ncbi:helix-turn-helix domain-containing protein [Kitasatospora sp. NPDC006697]|uniref:helix-turn-helix transcriptional regulator n=1 Tax=Kitasatospora sp. NPDC006697 TaxID=3364020 RepID=UPI0036B59E47
MTSDHVDVFTAQVRRVELGPVVLLGTSFPSIQVRRTERMIRRYDEELCHLTMLTTGGGRVAGHRTDGARTIGAGDLHLVSSSHPYDSQFSGIPGTGAAHGRVDGLGLDLPASLLPFPPDRLRDLHGRGVSDRGGTAAILAQFLTGLDRQAAALAPAEADRLGAVVVDLVAAWIARELDAEAALPEDTRHRAMLRSVREFVRRNLHDPALTPPVIAAAHHVSLSYLHRLFTQDAHGETLGAFIRRQRLRKARRDLADPALHAVPIHVIAARCGIVQASVFTRAFRAAYGISPSELRRQAMSEAADLPRAATEEVTAR